MKGSATRLDDVELDEVLPLGQEGCGIARGGDYAGSQRLDNGIVLRSKLGFDLWLVRLPVKRVWSRSL